MAGLDFSSMIDDEKKVVTDEKGSLLLVASPPGSGKTYGMVNYISVEMVKSDKFRAFFVTPQNKNLNDKEFYKNIVNEHEKKYGAFGTEADKERFLYQKVAVLRSLKDSIQVLLNDKLPIGYEENDELMIAWKILGKRYQQYIDGLNWLTEEEMLANYKTLKESYVKFQAAVRSQLMFKLKLTAPLSKEDKKEIAKYAKENSNPDSDFLNKHFPTIDLKSRQLIIVNWSKFVTTYPSFYSNASLPVSGSQCLGNALVVLDEIDEMKQILVDKIIDDSLKLPIDLLAVFGRVLQGIKKPQKNRPREIMTVLRRGRMFSQLKWRMESLTNRYELDQEYKVKEIKNKTNFIFNLDRVTTTSGKHWWSSQDLKWKQVILTQEKPLNNDLEFYKMIRDMQHFFIDFIKLMGSWSVDYQKIVNEDRLKTDNQFDVEDAMRTICDTIGLEKIDTNLIVGLYRQHNGVGRKQIKTLRSGQSLQLNGLQLCSLTDSQQHNLRTKISAALITTTPEKFLLKLVDRGMVVGLSATVGLENVISNFDFGFLRERLGERLINGLERLPQRSQDDLNVSKRCLENGATVKVVKVQADMGSYESIHMVKRLLKLRMPEMNISKEKEKQIADVQISVSQLMKDVRIQYEDDVDNYKYMQRRYLELFDSFICFLADEMMPTCLGLQSILPKSEADEHNLRMSQKRIDEVFKKLSELICSNEQKLPKLVMIGKNLSSKTIANQLKEAFKLPADEMTRVYILSAYKTLGVSQNLQHNLGELEKGRVVDIALTSADKNDARYSVVDIAGIYLGQITQIFTQFPECATPANVKTWVKGYYELLSLVDSGEISLFEASRYSLKQSSGIPVKQFRSTISYVGAHTRIVLQALGRLDRAFNKMPVTTVMLGTDVLDYYNVSTMKDYQLGPIASAMKDLQKRERQVVINAETIRQVRWENRTEETSAAVKKLVSKLRTSSKSAEGYQEFREILLKYPTVGARRYHEREDKAEFAYLDCPAVSYLVQREGEKFIFNTNGKGNEEISEEKAGLPAILKYPGMIEYFNKNHWEIRWKKQDYVINPVQFDNYKGILGEVAGKYVFEDQWKVKLNNLSQVSNEFFDFTVNNNIYIDFKLWRFPHEIDAEKARKQVLSKLKKADVTKEGRVLIINVLAPSTTLDFVPKISVDGKIMELPFLIDQSGKFALTQQQVKKVGDFIHGN